MLVLNATGPQPEAPVTEVAWADHVAQLDFFVKSPVLLGRAVLPGMQARRYGRIVQYRLRGRPPAAAGPVRLRRREERADRPDPELGS